jgi:GrpB-like predicted nucleotidyltransferase (UPF0157 family)
MGNSKPRRPDVHEVELVGGIVERQLELKTYDSRWPNMYLDHQRRIGDAFFAAEVEIEHIGSTSVPGLAAKPIIDIVVAAADITAEEDYLDALLRAVLNSGSASPGTAWFERLHETYMCTFSRKGIPPFMTTYGTAPAFVDPGSVPSENDEG